MTPRGAPSSSASYIASSASSPPSRYPSHASPTISHLPCPSLTISHLPCPSLTICQVCHPKKVHIARQLAEAELAKDGDKGLKTKPPAALITDKTSADTAGAGGVGGDKAAEGGVAKEDEDMPDADSSAKDKGDKEGSASKVAAAPPVDAGTSGLTARAMAVLDKARGPETKTDSKSSSSSSDKKGGGAGGETKEVKQMLKTMILGVKTVVWSVSNSRMTVQQPHPMTGAVGGAVHTLQKGMSEAECLLVARLLNSGLECFAIYNTGPEASAQEEKDVLDYFAGVFTVLDVRNFTQVFQMQVGHHAISPRHLPTPSPHAISTPSPHISPSPCPLLTPL